ncbi:MAG: hypothetical protein S0880_12765 [Actinomycetota bacterium]|nr:hypothetical protein [Actinomycetota bacterium]
MAVVGVGLIGLTGCGGSEDAAAGASSCSEIADGYVDAIRSALADAEEMSIEEMTGDPGAEVVTALEGRMAELDEQEAELDCDDEEMRAMQCERFGDIEAEGMVTRAIGSGVLEDWGC